MLILILGAASNVGFNYLLIPVMGIEGAAIGTLTGYIISLLTASIVLVRMKLLKISPRFIMSTLVMALVMLIWRIFVSDRMLPMLVLAIAASGVIIILYRKDLFILLGGLKAHMPDRKKS
jgi:Na+-driven multidrug efflux pump